MAPSPAVAKALEDLAESPDRAALYIVLFSNIADSASSSSDNAPSAAQLGEDLGATVESVMARPLGAVLTRQTLEKFAEALKKIASGEVTLAAGSRALAALAPQQASFPDLSVEIRELIADAHEAAGDFIAAAHVLAEMPLDSQQRRVTPADRARVWVRIARNYLEEDDSTSAETYVNKLMGVMGHDVTDPDLMVHFKLCQARVQDANRDFLAASSRYLDISLQPVVAEEERLHTLSMAIKCAVLAPAGPVRSRLLGRLYRDERSAGLDEHSILEKMFLDRLLTSEEVERFAGTLQPHQLAITSDGSTVLQRAVVEHNMLAVSRLYDNIAIDSLADRLGLSAEKAEETAASMIEQGRLVGSIDQLEGCVFFEDGEASGVRGSGRTDAPVGKNIRQWDANIERLSSMLEGMANTLQDMHPEFVQQQLEA
jgi:COP9 signalosome complex subunit 4